MKVHSALGPGLLESAYQACLAQELRLRGLFVQTQVQVPIVYEGVRLDVGYRIDLLVERSVIIDLKAVKQLHPIHEAQLLSSSSPTAASVFSSTSMSSTSATASSEW